MEEVTTTAEEITHGEYLRSKSRNEYHQDKLMQAMSNMVGRSGGNALKHTDSSESGHRQEARE